jgi:4-amino-4-deoxy-L-arabinose transferase-like glycosyltransferase
MRRIHWSFIIILCLAGTLFFYRLGDRGLLDPEEGRYAEIPREMLERGDWVTPRLNFMRYLEKPPLLYWCVAATYKIFGVREWSARLWCALPALIGVLAVYVWGRRVISPRAGLFAALVLATSPEYFALARTLETDMLFSTGLTIALLLGYLGFAEGAAGKKFYWGMWVALAGAVMTKGPTACVLLLAVLGLFWALLKRPPALRRVEWGVGGALFVVLTAPWFIAVSLRNPDFSRFYWWEQHVLRFFSNKLHLYHPPLYYLWVWVWGFCPWTLGWLWLAVQHGRHRWHGKPLPRYAVFLWCWSIFIFLFFTVSKSKLPTYILPVYPACALLVGSGWDEWLHRSASPRRARHCALRLGGLVAAMTVFFLYFRDAPVCLWFASYAPRHILLSRSVDFRRWWLPCPTLRPLARHIQQERQPGDKIAEYKCYAPSLAFYTGRRVILIGNWNELTWSMEHGGGGGYFLNGRRELARLLRRPQRLFCVAERKKFLRDLRGSKFETIQVLRQTADHVLFTNRAEVRQPNLSSARR